MESREHRVGVDHIQRAIRNRGPRWLFRWVWHFPRCDAKSFDSDFVVGRHGEAGLLSSRRHSQRKGESAQKHRTNQVGRRCAGPVCWRSEWRGRGQIGIFGWCNRSSWIHDTNLRSGHTAHQQRAMGWRAIHFAMRKSTQWTKGRSSHSIPWRTRRHLRRQTQAKWIGYSSSARRGVVCENDDQITGNHLRYGRNRTRSYLRLPL